MAIKSIVFRTGLILGAISDVSTILLVDSTFLDIVNSAMDFGAGDYFYLKLQEDDTLEEVKVVNATSTYLVIERAATAYPFTLAATYSTALGAAAVADIAAGVAPVAPITINGSGIANVTTDGAGTYTINVTQPNITGQTGIEVTQAFPDYGVALIAGGNCCEGDDIDTGGADINIVGSGISDVSNDGNGTYTINTPSPTFSGAGVTISGVWPNLIFTVTAVGSGTVTSVAVGPGLSITGNPAVNPTINFNNSGVTAGAYGDMVVNARGQITSIAVGFNPVSAIAAANGLNVGRAGSTVTVSGIDAAEGVKGVVALADADAPLDTDDITTAVTPKLLASVLSDIAGPELYGGQLYSGEAGADYTNVVPSTAISLLLDAGDKAIVFANLTVRDNSAPTVAQNYGIALFDATGNLLHANKKLTQNNQFFMAIISGPFNDGLVLKTTAMPGSAAIISQAVSALQL